MRTRTLLIAAALLPALAGVPGGAGPLTQDPCPGPQASVSVWKQLGNDVLENLLFADGSMWVSDGTASAVLRLGPDGGEVARLSNIPSPGGLAKGPDGLIYAGWGNSLANSITRNGAAAVVRIDPGAEELAASVVADGLNMVNGMTFGPDGSLYVSNDFDYGLLRIDTATGAHAEFAHVWGANGIVVRGGTMFAAVTFDARSPIARIGMADPSAVNHDFQLTFGAASLQPAVYPDPDTSAPLLGVKGLDDMTLGSDDNLYVVANGMGELLRVDPDTGAACLVASGFQNPSSVRVAPASSGFGSPLEPGSTDLFVTEFSGAIRRVHIPA